MASKEEPLKKKLSMSTPVDIQEYICYIDNPRKSFDFVQGLEQRETEIYSAGYIQACYHVMEALSELKTTFLTKALTLEEREDKVRLLRYVKLLDPLEESLKDRVNDLLAE